MITIINDFSVTGTEDKVDIISFVLLVVELKGDVVSISKVVGIVVKAEDSDVKGAGLTVEMLVIGFVFVGFIRDGSLLVVETVGL